MDTVQILKIERNLTKMEYLMIATKGKRGSFNISTKQSENYHKLRPRVDLQFKGMDLRSSHISSGEENYYSTEKEDSIAGLSESSYSERDFTPKVITAGKLFRWNL